MTPREQRLEAALRQLIDQVERWNAAVESIVGREPKTGMATREARAALAAEPKEKMAESGTRPRCCAAHYYLGYLDDLGCSNSDAPECNGTSTKRKGEK